MQTVLHAAQGAEALLLAAARIWAVAGELITAGALLWALDAVARLIRLAYRAGFLCGRLLWPVLHALAAAGRWFWANTDWAEVAAVVRAGGAVVVALAITAGHQLIPALCAASEALGRRYAALLVGTTTTPQQGAPVAAPAAVTKPTATTGGHHRPMAPQRRSQAPAAAPAALSALTVRELRQLARAAGHKALARSGRKADLLAALAA